MSLVTNLCGAMKGGGFANVIDLTEYQTKKENQSHLENKLYDWVKPGFHLVICVTSRCLQSLE